MARNVTKQIKKTQDKGEAAVAKRRAELKAKRIAKAKRDKKEDSRDIAKRRAAKKGS